MGTDERVEHVRALYAKVAAQVAVLAAICLAYGIDLRVVLQ